MSKFSEPIGFVDPALLPPLSEEDRQLLALLRPAESEKAFNPDQARDDHGRWSEEGASAQRELASGRYDRSDHQHGLSAEMLQSEDTRGRVASRIYDLERVSDRISARQEQERSPEHAFVPAPERAQDEFAKGLQEVVRNVPPAVKEDLARAGFRVYAERTIAEETPLDEQMLGNGLTSKDAIGLCRYSSSSIEVAKYDGHDGKTLVGNPEHVLFHEMGHALDGGGFGGGGGKSEAEIFGSTNKEFRDHWDHEAALLFDKDPEEHARWDYWLSNPRETFAELFADNMDEHLGPPRRETAFTTGHQFYLSRHMPQTNAWMRSSMQSRGYFVGGRKRTIYG